MPAAGNLVPDLLPTRTLVSPSVTYLVRVPRPSLSSNRATFEMWIVPSLSMMPPWGFFWAGFWWRFPELKFSLTEGDIGWIPYFLWRAEHTYRRHGGWTQAKFPAGYAGPIGLEYYPTQESAASVALIRELAAAA